MGFIATQSSNIRGLSGSSKSLALLFITLLAGKIPIGIKIHMPSISELFEY